jgi:hypothetical protein
MAVGSPCRVSPTLNPRDEFARVWPHLDYLRGPMVGAGCPRSGLVTRCGGITTSGKKNRNQILDCRRSL